MLTAAEFGCQDDRRWFPQGIKRERGACTPAQCRGCPRNCKRRACDHQCHWELCAFLGRWSEAMTREPGDLPPQEVTRGRSRRGVLMCARPVAPSRGAVRDERRQFAVTELLPRVSSCPSLSVMTQVDLAPAAALKPKHEASPVRRRTSILSSSTPQRSTPPTTSHALLRSSVGACVISATCSISAPAAASSDAHCVRRIVAGPLSSPRRTCVLGLRTCDDPPRIIAERLGGGRRSVRRA